MHLTTLYDERLESCGNFIGKTLPCSHATKIEPKSVRICPRKTFNYCRKEACIPTACKTANKNRPKSGHIASIRLSLIRDAKKWYLLCVHVTHVWEFMLNAFKVEYISRMQIRCFILGPIGAMVHLIIFRNLFHSTELSFAGSCYLRAYIEILASSCTSNSAENPFLV